MTVIIGNRNDDSKRKQNKLHNSSKSIDKSLHVKKWDKSQSIEQQEEKKSNCKISRQENFPETKSVSEKLFF